MIRYAVVGSGWRSEFYARIAKALPQNFQMTAWLCRNDEKVAKLSGQYGIFATTREEDVLSTEPDFVVSAVNKGSMGDVVRYWAAKGIPVLSETPAALDVDTIKSMRAEIAAGARIQVAEQYFMYPTIKAMTDEIAAGTIGEPVSVTLSAVHDYHAASVIRRLLGVGLEVVNITGKSLMTEVTDTRTRYEVLTDGHVSRKEQKHLIMEYASGKAAFYDFMSDQYRSPIRNRYINVRGTRGEIISNMESTTVHYLGDDNIAVSRILKPSNPYEEAGLSEDETAIARIMLGMKEYIDTGREIYPMNEAFYDAYISLLMCRAGEESFSTVVGSFDDI